MDKTNQPTDGEPISPPEIVGAECAPSSYKRCPASPPSIKEVISPPLRLDAVISRRSKDGEDLIAYIDEREEERSFSQGGMRRSRRTRHLSIKKMEPETAVGLAIALGCVAGLVFMTLKVLGKI